MKKIILIWFFMMFSMIFSETNSIYNTKIDMKRYPNASVVTLLDRESIIFNKDNSYIIKKHIIKRILNYKGKKASSEYKIKFDKRFEKVDIINAKTVKISKSGIKEIAVDKSKNIRIIDAPSDVGLMKYAAHKMEVIAFPAVNEGDIIDIEYTIKNNKKQKISGTVNFASREAVYNKVEIINIPKDMNFNITKFNWNTKMEYMDNIAKDRKIIKFSEKFMPQILDESNIPESLKFMPTVIFTNYNNWAEYRDELLGKFIKINKSKENLQILKEIKEKVLDKLITKDMTNMKKEEIIQDFIAKHIEIKYIDNLLDFEASSPKEILTRGYGTSLDIENLFLLLLKEEGISGEIVILGSDKLVWDDVKKGIDMNRFNYAISKVTIDNKDYFVDATNEFSKLGESVIENNIGLILDTGKPEFVNVKSIEKNITRIEKSYNIKIDLNGDALINKTIYFYGINAIGEREKYKYMTPIMKQQDYQKELGMISQNAYPISKQMDVELGSPVKISYTYKYTNFASIDGDFIYFDLPYRLDMLDLFENVRKYPFELVSDILRKNNISIEYPANYKVRIAPKSLEIKEKNMLIKRDLKIGNSNGGNKIILDTVVRYNSHIYTIEEYSKLYKILEKLNYPKNAKVLLEKE
ncbi:DUF3857 domain-containing protein [Haliovirga abyssi]|uniref:DUF3857 domain-containing protein n=1 Tax=Haliovirga abyssi TaxID=2996794 RepID=A0AAU9DXK4_9FUSO|nr:DUF3857 domain-containing protein [Haliovirga abyssi]BDU51196.1 hypothetical protein HLVA_17650 [Haliovirga abyssi]